MVSPLHRKLLRDLERLWVQLLAAALVMAAGIAALTMSVSTTKSLARALDSYYEQYRFPHAFAHLKRAPNSLAPRIEEIPGVGRVRTRVVVDVNLDVPGAEEPAIGRIISVPDRPPYGLSELHLRRGRLPEPGRAGEAVASEPFMDAHRLPLGARVGAIINGRYQQLEIVGVAISPEFVYQIRPGDVFPDDRLFGVFWMNDRAIAPSFDLDGAFNNVIVSLAPGASEPRVVAALDGLLAPYGGVGAFTRRDQTSHRLVSDELEQLRVMAVVPPIIFLSVAAFIINIIFGRLVRAQREQIAALKAFGYSRLAVGAHYAEMALVVAAVGAGLGAVGGWRMGALLTDLYIRFYRFPRFEYSLSTEALFFGGVAGAGAALAGAFVAVRRAAALPPAEAMRPESPPDYRATLVERLRLQTLFSPGARMVLRHLERQPLRAVLSCAGISLAVAVLIVGSFMHGALLNLIDFLFFQVQRQDATVAYVEPASPSARDEIARLPGVLDAEPFRAVPTRIRAGPRARLQVVTGLREFPRLSRVLDEQGKELSLPVDGLLLSEILAELLAVGPGDTVTLEVLEGRRPVLETRVVAVASTRFGTAAYMEIGALNRLLAEGPVTSGSHLRIDPARKGEVYASLKRTPRVGSVALKLASLDAFRKTIGENILIMRGFNLAFASLIAFGVIYNTARVALAERAHELATLRILGLTRAEVSRVLLGELAVITLFAIPPGMLIGRVLAGAVVSLTAGETVRIPVVVLPGTYAFAAVMVMAATICSGFVVRRAVNRLDLVSVLKVKS